MAVWAFEHHDMSSILFEKKKKKHENGILSLKQSFIMVCFPLVKFTGRNQSAKLN